MKVKVFTGKEQKENVDVKPEMFMLALNEKLIAQVVQWQLANSRKVIAHTKTRGEVSGGGRKPHRQKGTGRARAGSSRSPIWIGGGITFGPRKTRNFKKRIPQKMLDTAIFMALSEKIKNNKFIVVKEIKLKNIATREVQDFFEKLPIEEGKILVILSKTEPNFELSAANLPYIKVIQSRNINLVDLLKFDFIVIDKEGIKALEKQFGGKNE